MDSIKALAVINQIAAKELGHIRRPRRPNDPNRNKLQKVRRLAKHEGLGLRDALDKYNRMHGLDVANRENRQ